MLRPLPLLLIVALAVSGCARLSQSRLNPANWFGPSRPATTAPPRAAAPDTRLPVAEVIDMALEPTESGAILRATGTMSGTGWHDARLVPVADAPGVLAYEFRAAPPPGGIGGGTQVIVVARSLGAGDLAGISRVEVRAQGNARAAQR